MRWVPLLLVLSASTVAGGAPPPPPKSEPAVCGNGKVDQGYQYLCASCIPGRPCACGWAPANAEPCDGADLGGNTCLTLGFNEGVLRCTAQCQYDTSDCRRVVLPPPPPPAWTKLLTRTSGPEGSNFAVAVNGGTLLVAGVYGASLNVHAFDTQTLYERGSTYTVSLPPRQGGDVTLGDVFAAPMGEGFLVAVMRVGEPRTYVFRIAANGRIEGPVATVEARPLFLAGGTDAVLLGTTRGSIRLGPDGKPQGRLQPLFELPTWGEALHPAAAFTGKEWVVAVAARQGAESVARLDVARVKPSASATSTRGVAEISDAYHPLGIASEGERVFVVYLKGAAVWGAELAPTGALGEPIQLGTGSFNRVLAARLERGVLTVWASAGRSRITRLRFTPSTRAFEATELMDVSRADARVGVVANGMVYLVLSDEASSKPLLYRGP
jgi:hypothetical protein